MTMDRRALLTAAALAPFAAPARAAETRAETQAEIEQRMREDWPALGRYAEDNRRLLSAGERIGIVFMGDSITQGWRDKRPEFFKPGRVGRGIGGQTTPQMLLRMMADVVALRPRAVHIMAGTNDIAGNTGVMSRRQTYDNLTAMTQIAQANRIAVILASVPPAARFPWRPGLNTVEPIRVINDWIREYARTVGATFVDYTPAIGDGRGGIRPGLAYDGVHPEAAGYAEMERTLSPTLQRMKL